MATESDDRPEVGLDDLGEALERMAFEDSEDLERQVEQKLGLPPPQQDLPRTP